MSLWLPPVTLHSFAIVASVLTYVLTTRAERERRPPSIAIAWVLGMLALPYVALPMYLMFGRRKLPRRILRALPRREHSSHWAEDLVESFGLPSAAPSEVRFHADGHASQDALFALMSGATQRLDICTYILGDDAFGRDVIERMVECAHRGVRVRLLLDGVGALQWSHVWFKRLNRRGVETAIFSPLLARRTQGPRNLRNHRKWVVADGARLWAGGRNLAAEYFTGTGEAGSWKDLTFELDGRTAATAAHQFEADWAAAGGRAAEHCAGAAKAPTDAARSHLTQFLPSGPDQTEDTVHALLIDACFHASRRILAVTPYFVPDVSLETAFRLAARRGVQIDLCIPAKSNHGLADFVRNRSLRALGNAGCNVHLLPAMNHAKVIVFDDTLALCGSCNLDSRSLLLNYESAVMFYDREHIEWLAHWITDLIPHASSFDPRPPAFWRDVCEGLLLTVAYQL